MHKHLNFKNVRVLNTRPEHQAQTTSEKILLAGGHVITFPLLTIKNTTPHWINNLPALETIQHAIFISPNAVHYFFNHISTNNWPTSIISYAIGHGTHIALQAQGILNAILPQAADSEHLLLRAELQAVQQQNILLIKGNHGRTLLQNTLIKRGANLIPLAVYQRALPKPSPAYTQSLWHEDAVDIILITSETALKHLFILFDDEAAAWLRSKTCWVISPRLGKIARKNGFKQIIIEPLSI